MASTRIGRMITRETGTALAVLAVWMLSLLAPLHQTSGVLREMAKAGYDISGAWTICVTLAEAEGDDPVVPVCPAQGIGKADVPMPPVFLLTGFVALARDVVFKADVLRMHRSQNFTPGQPRAPPTAV